MFKRALYVTAWLISCAGYAQVGGPGTVVVGGVSGGGAGVTGLTSCSDGTALADNALMRADGTTKCQGSTVTVADSTGDLQWEGTTADGFEGNFTFADPTADWTWNWTGTGIAQGSHLELATGTGSNFYGDASVSLVVNRGSNGSLMAFYNKDNGAAVWARGTDNISVHQQFNSTSTIGWSSSYNNAGINDTSIGRAAAGVVGFADGSTGGGALHLNPLASPPRTCDATAEGDFYSDTSHALCWCDGSAWQKLSGAGTCA